MPSPRYAVYLAPSPEHPLWTLGSAWLGRDARAGQPVTPAPRPGLQGPWRYGFHATVLAPMTLRVDAAEHDFVDAVQGVAAHHARFAWPAMQVVVFDAYLALRPVRAPSPGHPMRLLADDCVKQLDDWREPLAALERARRLAPCETQRQRHHVERWGYPHVLDDWQMHLSLSDPLDEPQPLLDEARLHFAPALGLPLAVDSLCVFVEAEPGAPFELRYRCPLGAPFPAAQPV
jgi:Protein of unknown function (DUF1045)